jgi:hypothetical protein
MNEDLQKAWDRWLVESFYKRPHMNTGTVCGIFKGEHANDLSWDELNAGLKRFPQTPGHCRVTVTRFICAYLPKIADVLWKHSEKDIDRLAAAVSKLKSTCRAMEADYLKASADRNEIRKSSDQMKLAAIKKDGVAAQFQAGNRGNQWNVVK